MKERGAAAASLFFGSLWGLAEATVGHGLHALRLPGLAGFLMFPLGMLFMSLAYARGRNLRSVLMTSWTAASIKLIDLLIPGTDVMAVLNPDQAILLKGLAAAGLFHYLGSRPAWVFERNKELPANRPGNFASLFFASAASALAWRSTYLAASFLTAAIFAASNIFRVDGVPIARFLVLDSTVNAALIVLLLTISFPSQNRNPGPAKVCRPILRPVVSLAALAAALFLEAVL